jgi:hypothetical protein
MMGLKRSKPYRVEWPRRPREPNELAYHQEVDSYVRVGFGDLGYHLWILHLQHGNCAHS